VIINPSPRFGYSIHETRENYLCFPSTQTTEGPRIDLAHPVGKRSARLRVVPGRRCGDPDAAGNRGPEIVARPGRLELDSDSVPPAVVILFLGSKPTAPSRSTTTQEATAHKTGVGRISARARVRTGYPEIGA